MKNLRINKVILSQETWKPQKKRHKEVCWQPVFSPRVTRTSVQSSRETGWYGRVGKKARREKTCVRAAPMSRPILLQAKQSLLIIPAEISREKQTASSLTDLQLQNTAQLITIITQLMAGAYHQEPATTPYSCHGVFTDRSIFSLNLFRIQIPTGTTVTNCNHKQGLMSTCSREASLFYPYRIVLMWTGTGLFRGKNI